ncbi:MAG: helix-turn-helix domain-containing protein [Clostridium sp.]
MLYKTLGTRIRDERLKLNLTQEELAEKANISPSYMGRIERGERNPTLENLVKIANILGTTIDYLLKDCINPNTDNTIEQMKALLSERSLEDKKMALDVVKVMLAHIDERNLD